MRYQALACDYDGTLAHHGRVDAPTLAALERFRQSGRRLIMVTGRELPELLANFPELSIFEWVVAENGALLYHSADREEKTLAPPIPEAFVALLRKRGVDPISVGRVIVATWEPYETTVLGAIHDLGLELQVIFNKGAVMVLPAGVNKASGLRAALETMGLSAHEVVGVGDAENDHAFLSICECGVAVANALPALKSNADWATLGDHGAGVAELIDAILTDDLTARAPRLARHALTIGAGLDHKEVHLPPYGPNVLIAGPSGSGKSSVATSLLERLAERQYQFCIIDPEGDYEGLEGAIILGNSRSGPVASEVLQALVKPTENVVVNLVGLPLADRPSFFHELLPRLQEMRSHTGRPHWLLVHEAHRLAPASWEQADSMIAKDWNRTLFVTVHPDQAAPAVLASVGTVIAVGPNPEDTIAQFCRAVQETAPPVHGLTTQDGDVIFWARGQGDLPQQVHITPSKSERHRHARKVAEGELPAEQSFYFRGPEGKLHLRAQNLTTFLQLADGVDDDTWMHHLHAGDYSRWFRAAIQDAALAEAAAEMEHRNLSAQESRARIREFLAQHYPLPPSLSGRPA